MQVVQKTTTYQPEEHLDPVILGRLKLMGRARPIGSVKSCASGQGFVRMRQTFTTTVEEGASRKDWLSFTIRDSGNANHFTQDIKVTSLGTLAINVGQSDIRNITLPDSSEYSFGLSARTLNRDPRLDLLGIKLPGKPMLLKIRDSLRTKVIAKLALLLEMELEDQEFNMELIDLAITLISTTDMNDQYDCDSNRSRIVSRATEAVRLQDPRNLTPGLVATSAFTSVRTLEYAFQEVIGMTPKQYIDYYRVNLLRERLIATPQIPILQLGDAVGLPHLGNLSRIYRALYGETPSVTKRRLARL